MLSLSSARSKTEIYDFALDFFDSFENLDLPIKDGVDCFTALEIMAVDYLNGVTPISLENDLCELVIILANSDSQLANDFVKKYKISSKLIKEIETDKKYE